MRPPDGMTFERIESDDPDVVKFRVTAESIVHRCPIGDGGITPCCEQTPFELPHWHRLTLDDSLVTCPHNPPLSASPQGSTDG